MRMLFALLHLWRSTMSTLSHPALLPHERVLSLLQGVRPSSDGWIARCPGHEDEKPSLSVRVADDGRLLLHCHAGCSLAAILKPLDLQLRDLFPHTQKRGFSEKPGFSARSRIV